MMRPSACRQQPEGCWFSGCVKKSCDSHYVVVRLGVPVDVSTIRCPHNHHRNDMWARHGDGLETITLTLTLTLTLTRDRLHVGSNPKDVGSP